ncbi:tryptophan 7-halogenase, partial [Escherichia coli]
PDSLAERLALFESSARFFQHGKAELFREESWVQVLIGQGLRMRYDPMVDMIDAGELARFMDDMVEVIADVAGAMPMQQSFIDR